ncbi:hypothetical protein [Candidatus Methylocalor cossyra]|uniref:ERF superfamily protein n=1 Tax=Candidatus Methylocalor cossyra TaxID=3108543 RepID=A0ABM9NEM8_9GAMM
MAQMNERELLSGPRGQPSATVESRPDRSGVPAETQGQPSPRDVAPAFPSASPLDLPNDVFEAGLARRRQNRAAILGWIRESLVEGTDYGRIHVVSRERCAFAKRGAAAQCPTASHWTKPSLFKPGAEKICGMLGVTVHYPNLTAYEQAALDGKNLGTIILRCELRDSQNRVVAEGIGARNVQQDYGDLNKSLKMAGKSAHIDATLRMAGLSEVFTQDLEDMHLGAVARGAGPEAASGDEPDPQAGGSPAGVVSPVQIAYLESRIRALALDRERVLRWIRNASRDRIQSFEELTPDVYDRVVSKLEGWAKPAAGETG